MFKIPLIAALLAALGYGGTQLADRYQDHRPRRPASQAQVDQYDPTPNYGFDSKRKKHRRFDPTPNVSYDPTPRHDWWFESWFDQHPQSYFSRWFYKLSGDRREDVRDRFENKQDRRENVWDRKENVWDRKEDVRDRREDFKDALTQGGRRDRLE